MSELSGEALRQNPMTTSPTLTGDWKKQADPLLSMTEPPIG